MVCNVGVDDCDLLVGVVGELLDLVEVGELSGLFSLVESLF